MNISVKNILHIVDMQNSFTNKKGALFIKNADLLINKINLYLKDIKKDDYSSIIYTQDTHFIDEYPLQQESKEFPIHCIYNSFDWNLSIDINNVNKDIEIFRLFKNQFDCFAKSNLNINNIKNEYDKSTYKKLGIVENHKSNEKYNNILEFLQQYPPQNTTITIIGVALDYCVKYAIDGYLSLNYKVKILKDLNVGIHKQNNDFFNQQYYQKYIKNNLLIV
jgi:nicotinamidase/pyrazinamidase